MFVEAQVTINESRAAIWAAITNIENASDIISGIEKIEVVEKPGRACRTKVARDPHPIRRASYRGKMDH